MSKRQKENTRHSMRIHTKRNLRRLTRTTATAHPTDTPVSYGIGRQATESAWIGRVKGCRNKTMGSRLALIERERAPSSK